MNAEYFNACFTYFAKTGVINWKNRPKDHFKTKGGWHRFNSRLSGKEAGWISSNKKQSYRMIEVNGKTYTSHYIAWVMIYKEPPKHQIDHINGSGLDNRKRNLRDVDQSENNRNRKIPINNKSGVVGVNWRKQSNAWHAQINDNGKRVHLGLFKNKKDAIKARKQAEIMLGYHVNHGRK